MRASLIFPLFVQLTAIRTSQEQKSDLTINFLRNVDAHRNLLKLCPLIINNEPCLDLENKTDILKKLIDAPKSKSNMSFLRKKLVYQRSLCCIQKQCAMKCDNSIFDNQFSKGFPNNIELLLALDRNLIEVLSFDSKRRKEKTGKISEIFDNI